MGSKSQVIAFSTGSLPFVASDHQDDINFFLGKHGSLLLHIFAFHLYWEGVHSKVISTTLPETNMAPENGWLECWNT